MAKNSTLYSTSGFNMFGVSILPADTTVAKTLFTAPAEGSVIKSINISSSDTSDRYFELSVSDGANSWILGTIPVPLSSGQSATGAVVSVNVLDSTKIKGLEKDICGNYILKLAPNWILKGRVIVAVTADKQISIVGSYESITA